MVKILVVDDTPDSREQLERVAKGEGREVISAGTAREAIELIRKNDFDVIVTDLKMETETAGIEVLKAAKEKDLFMQVIVVTAYGSPEVSVETMRLGAFDYLDRNAPGVDFRGMMRKKVQIAIEFRDAIVKERVKNE